MRTCNRLLVGTIFLMVVLTIVGQILRVFILRDIERYDMVMNQELGPLMNRAKIDDPSRASFSVIDRSGQAHFDSSQLDKKLFYEISASADRIAERIMLMGNIYRSTFGFQALLVIPLIVSIYRNTKVTIRFGVAARIAALFTIPFALLFAGFGIFDLPKPAELQKLLSFLAYPSSWVICLLFLWKHLETQRGKNRIEGCEI